jgi:HAE1 family hydrophobic/amphiphilic exporter-1
VNIAGLFIRRPVTTTLVMLGILLFGIMAYNRLPVSDLPNVDFPTIQVTANLPGASPETMASAVATPLERQFTTIAGLDSMTSSSALGSTQITLQFSLSRELDAAAQDVQAAISKVVSQLPPDMPSPPTYQKVNPADSPILYVALTSPTLPMWTLDEYGETTMAQRISTISGVAQVLVYGAQKYAVRVQLDPRALASRGIGIDEVRNAVQAANVNLPTGTLFGEHKAFTVEASGQLTEAQAYRPLIVAYRDGAPVRLSELGRVIDSVENDKTAAWYVEPGKEQRSIVLAVQRQPGTNTVEVAGAVRALLPRFRRELPASVNMSVLFDRSESIRDSVNDVKFTLLLTLMLVVLVIFLFLRNVSATVIPSLALPMSIVGTFAVMYGLGYSLDNLSLMALTLSVGFVVDDAIVMLENIVRHMEMGEAPFQAALTGAREIGFTIVSMTLSLAAVFIPVLFMGGLIGRLFHEFAVTIGSAILVSGFVSLTLTPMLCSRFLRHQAAERHGRVYQATEGVFRASLALYERSLRWSVRHRWVTVLGSAAVMAATVWLAIAVPKGFLPSEDMSQIFAFTEAAEGISFDSMVEHQRALNRIVEKQPEIAAFLSTTGARGGVTSSNSGILFMRLKPRRERGKTVDQVIQELRPKLMSVPGIRAFLQNPPPIRIGGQLTKSLYQCTLQGADTGELYRVAPLLEAKMRELPGFQDVTTDLQLKNPQVEVDILRDRAAAVGVSAAQIEDALFDAYGARQISTIYAPNNEYKVIMQLLPQYQMDPAALSLLYVRASSGRLVPLDAVADLRPALGPLTVNHLGQLPAVTISFNLKPGMSLGEATAAVQRETRTILPPTITMSFQGAAQAFQASLQGLGLLLVMAILVIYLVLGILYESFIHPVTILSALPFAGFGALATLLMFGTELSIYAFVGIIMLVGLVKKNGIMMIDFAIEARRRGAGAEDAILEACVVRFRPIMMTTMAALMGTLPIALGLGAGAESRRPLGLAVVGGLLFSQMLTLYVTPVVYVYMEHLQEWLGRVFVGRRAEAGPHAATHSPAAAHPASQAPGTTGTHSAVGAPSRTGLREPGSAQ